MKKPPHEVKEVVHRMSLAPLSELLNPEKARVLNFEASLIDADTIRRIAQRAADIAHHFGYGADKMAIAMEITAVHLNIRKLMLLQLLMACDADFTHDVFGITRYLNKRDCVLTEGFTCKFFVVNS
jgi:hypothetical protein